MSITPAPAHARTPGDRLLATPPPALPDAVAAFIAAWALDLATVRNLATDLNCGEADTLAALLYAAGHGETARTLLNEHATADDSGDRHGTA